MEDFDQGNEVTKVRRESLGSTGQAMDTFRTDGGGFGRARAEGLRVVERGRGSGFHRRRFDGVEVDRGGSDTV